MANKILKTLGLLGIIGSAVITSSSKAQCAEKKNIESYLNPPDYVLVKNDSNEDKTPNKDVVPDKTPEPEQPAKTPEPETPKETPKYELPEQP